MKTFSSGIETTDSFEPYFSFYEKLPDGVWNVSIDIHIP